MVFDLLLKYSLTIVGEHIQHDKHCLCALPGVARADIRTVASHPLALQQCRGHLTRMQLLSPRKVRSSRVLVLVRMPRCAGAAAQQT